MTLHSEQYSNNFFVSNADFFNRAIDLDSSSVHTHPLAINMAHLLTGNKFDPNKDIPDLSGKVRQ